MILRARRIERLEEHPNLRGILGILAQLVHTSDEELGRLAAEWRNSPGLAVARDRALSPDSPLVVEVLAAFDALSAIYADDLSGAEYVMIDPSVTAAALRSMRDALAAAYARPILSRSEYAGLMRPWRTVYPRVRSHEPDLGPSAADVKRVLAALPRLAVRCHDARSSEVFEGLLVTALTRDETDHQEAMDAAFGTAVLTGRRRVWTLVRRSAAEGFWRPCQDCRGGGALLTQDPSSEARVMELCADLACALLVEDLLDPALCARLTTPLAALIPLQDHSVR